MQDKKKLFSPLCMAVILMNPVFTGVWAATAVDASVVSLRTSCSAAGAEIDSCFSTVSDLQNWITTVRDPVPSAAAPLKVEIFPGTHYGSMNLTCRPTEGFTGHISFAGSGAGQTIMAAVPNAFASPLPYIINNCTGLSFSDMSITSDSYGAIVWSGGGDSRWSNVDVDAPGRAWYEPTCGAQRGSHYWFSSKLISRAKYTIASTYRATCDESWFFGSEVTASIPASEQVGESGAILATDAGIVHVYGSVLRVFLDGGLLNYNYGRAPAAGVGAVAGTNNTGGEIHIHGTGIDVFSDTGKDVVALDASSGGMIHADATAYNLKTSGSKTRLLNTGDSGMIHAPYQWDARDAAPDVFSTHGSDTAVVNAADGQPHLLIYSGNCASRWFDVVTASCH